MGVLVVISRGCRPAQRSRNLDHVGHPHRPHPEGALVSAQQGATEYARRGIMHVGELGCRLLPKSLDSPGPDRRC